MCVYELNWRELQNKLSLIADFVKILVKWVHKFKAITAESFEGAVSA